MSESGGSTPVAGNSSDSVWSDGDVDLNDYWRPRFVLGKKVSADRREGPVQHLDLVHSRRLEPFVVEHDNKNYVGIVGELFMHNADIIDRAYMIIGPNRVVNVQPSDVYSIDCSLAPPRGYSWRRRAGKIRFSVSAVMARFWARSESD